MITHLKNFWRRKPKNQNCQKGSENAGPYPWKALSSTTDGKQHGGTPEKLTTDLPLAHGNLQGSKNQGDVDEEESGDRKSSESLKPPVKEKYEEDVSEQRSGEKQSEGEDEDEEDEEPEEDFPAQKEITGYKLISKIGEGAFSEVYRALPLKHVLGSSKSRYKQVAIKIIHKQKLSSTDRSKGNDSGVKVATREQVLKEVSIHKMVSSGKHIVTFIEFQETEFLYCIVQELLVGGEIFGEIVKFTYFSEDLSRHVIKQLALAVKHMHTLGVVHRDIKPENLLFEPIELIPSPHPKLRKSDDPKAKLDEGVFRPNIGGGGIGVVKLADFGLSKQIFSSNTKTPCGTVGYTAPEVVKDERYSTKVDMWGIGCVLYTMLCGFPPFYDKQIDVLTELISRGQYTFLEPWWDEISNGAKNAVRKLLEVNPNNRYDIDEFLNDPWLNATNSSQDFPHPTPRSSHTRKPYKKDSALLYSPAAVVMRDAFDVSNAVQRKEEAKRHTPGGHALGALHESDEDTAKSTLNNLEQEAFNLCLDNSTIIQRRHRKNNLSPFGG
ncbi:HCL111Cp [Eremothecium sinecaudum]|uniref:non-specific serine/threonine protein kinase n=1 Tax=Eremothecium sinecaudum TaxID=45286 RepID=A0A109UYL5_9SACH|nr:HCL111Cp [Eremothecium sinecaudum]AMD20040.1 HCL111Cp [Eremothecium sinecaudum]